MTTLLRARGLCKEYTLRRGALGGRAGTVQALRDVDIELEAGECLSIVGESGSGKTTLGRCLIRLIEPTSGAVYYRDENLLELSQRELRRRRRFFQMIFQDPYGSLNPRLRVGATLAEPLRIHQIVPPDAVGDEVGRLLELVGLPRAAAERYPHEFSGGQRQRIGIARALAPRPEVVIADEPVSALDVSVQAQILNLILDLRSELGLSILFIAHDLAVVEAISDRVGVMHAGQMVEIGRSGQVFAQPQADYTRRLLAAVPRVRPRHRGAPT